MPRERHDLRLRKRPGSTAKVGIVGAILATMLDRHPDAFRVRHLPGLGILEQEPPRRRGCRRAHHRRHPTSRKLVHDGLEVREVIAALLRLESRPVELADTDGGEPGLLHQVKVVRPALRRPHLGIPRRPHHGKVHPRQCTKRHRPNQRDSHLSRPYFHSFVFLPFQMHMSR